MIKSIKKNPTFPLLLGIFIIYLFYKQLDDSIVYLKTNYLLLYGTLFFSTIAFMTLTIPRVKVRLTEKLLISIFCGYLLCVVLLIPVNVYNANYSKSQPLEHSESELLSISKRRLSRGMYIQLKGKTVFIRGFEPIFNEIEQDKLSKYRVLVSYRYGLFNSLIIEKHEIVKK